ncbi:MAG: hypothetical protein J2P35_10945 [Actinobacteria bacterium]|nr:hypothetical protein [Actinomycetota bacterium]MBO0784956.1 hypothetical protein [Actinomycetota bacterium]MBO0813587.1 hypothetical protein [Actinomycetota bacterium]
MARMRRGIGTAVMACATAVASGCAGGGTAGATPAGNATSAAPGRPAAGSGHRSLAARYLAIAKAGNERLEIDLDGLAGRDRNQLAAAKADLRDAAATERLFDRRLLRIGFPPAIEATARRLYRVNQSRAALTAAAATAGSLHDLHARQPALTAANRPVEQAVRMIRRQLGLPPPAS